MCIDVDNGDVAGSLEHAKVICKAAEACIRTETRGYSAVLPLLATMPPPRELILLPDDYEDEFERNVVENNPNRRPL